MSDGKLKEFINDSFIGTNVKLNADIIIRKTELSPDELAAIRDEGKYVFREKNKIYEMEIGGEVMARGKIVKKKNGYFFKITDILGGRS